MQMEDGATGLMGEVVEANFFDLNAGNLCSENPCSMRFATVVKVNVLYWGLLHLLKYPGLGPGPRTKQ